MDEEALQINQAKYQAIFESTGTATLMVEADTTISMANNECFFVDRIFTGRTYWT